MLEKGRSQDYLYDVPKYELEEQDVYEFEDDLKGMLAEFADCFSRQEPRDNLYQYMAGQLSKLDRKSIEPIALHIEDAKVRAMQHFVSNVRWDEEKILSKYRSMVMSDLGDSEGVLIFDESSFVKKGNESAGVARQYCGSIGKVENCQVGVFAAYASQHGYCLLGNRLYIPEDWFSEEFATRRKKCLFPDDLSFKTKPELAVELLRNIHQEKIVSFHYVAADSVYGNSPNFISSAEEIKDVIYIVSMPSDTLCWLEKPEVEEKQYQYKGEVKTKQVLKTPENKPIDFQTIAQTTSSFYWYRRTVSEGTKGPITYDFCRKRVTLANKGMPKKEVWLLIRRTLGDNPVYSYFISNAPADCRLGLLVWLSGVRWAIEQCFEETKTELGMAQYEVRKLPGWYHHMITCMLAHFFLWHLKLKLEKKSTIYYFVTA